MGTSDLSVGLKKKIRKIFFRHFTGTLEKHFLGFRRTGNRLPWIKCGDGSGGQMWLEENEYIDWRTLLESMVI